MLLYIVKYYENCDMFICLLKLLIFLINIALPKTSFFGYLNNGIKSKKEKKKSNREEEKKKSKREEEKKK